MSMWASILEMVDDLGQRPPEHWECLTGLGGCGGCWSHEPERCPCGAYAVWKVMIYQNADIDIWKEV